MNNEYEIRILRFEDLSEALSLVWRVFLKYEACDYSEEGIQEFKKYIDYDDILSKIKAGNLKIWASYDGDKVVGIIAVRPVCHISLMFVDSGYHRRGIARSLFRQVLDYYEMGNYSEITVNSSPYAKEVYHSFGFRDLDDEQVVNGIRFIPMKCNL